MIMQQLGRVGQIDLYKLNKMIHTYQIDGIHCGSCVTKIKNELLKLGDVMNADVQLKIPQATISMQRHITTENLQKAISKAGTYTIKEHEVRVPQVEVVDTNQTWFVTYRPLLLIFAFITLISTLSAWDQNGFHGMIWMNNFMAGFFIAFSFFKFLDIKGFADSYSSYDLLAKKAYVYGFIYPFIELGLGLAYLSNLDPVYTSVITIIVMGFSSIGVIQAVANKRKIRCACLGAVFNLPMSTVTIIEDLLMVAMASFSLFYLL
jgi:cation transport ATPase